MMRSQLQEKRPSTVDGLTVGQVNAILLWNSLHKQFNVSKNNMYPVVFGAAKNGRYSKLVMQVLLMYSSIVDQEAIEDAKATAEA